MIKRLCKKAVKYIIAMLSAVVTLLLHHHPGSDKELSKIPFHKHEHPWEERFYNDSPGMIKDRGTSAASGTSTVFSFPGTHYNQESY